MYKINISQLASILDMGKYPIYAKVDTLFPNINKDEDTKEYEIDIDKFLTEHKVNTFLFDYEVNRTSFSERLKSYVFPDTIDAKLAKEILNLNTLDNYNLRKLRVNNKIEAKQIKETRYNYDTNSILKRAVETGNIPFYYKYSKQFYTPKEVVAILNDMNLAVNTRALYRYIYDYNKVPCIKTGAALRIPILEFEANVIPNAKDIFKNFIK